MYDLQLHTTTRHQLERLARQLPHGLLLAGQEGLNLQAAARYVAEMADARTLWILPEKDEKVDEVEGRITIDIIRRLYRQTEGKQEGPLIVILTRADTMQAPAQNAFLKLLEEPAPLVHFVLLADHPEMLQATIVSRVQTVYMQRITAEQSGRLLTALHINDATRRQQLLFLAEGLPLRLHQLATNESLFRDEVELLKTAHTLIGASKYERLVHCYKAKYTRQTARQLVDYMLTALQRTIETKQRAAPQLVELLAKLVEARKLLEYNVNVRLTLCAALL